MKKLNLGWNISIVFLLICILANSVHNRLESFARDQQMKTFLLERNSLDSLYRDHLSECSFISKEEVAIDSRGYFYSTYRNNSKKTK